MWAHVESCVVSYPQTVVGQNQDNEGVGILKASVREYHTLEVTINKTKLEECVLYSFPYNFKSRRSRYLIQWGGKTLPFDANNVGPPSPQEGAYSFSFILLSLETRRFPLLVRSLHRLSWWFLAQRFYKQDENSKNVIGALQKILRPSLLSWGQISNVEKNFYRLRGFFTEPISILDIDAVKL